MQKEYLTVKKTTKSYIAGFIILLVLTLLAYFATVSGYFSKGLTNTIIVFFALGQVVVQLLFFLNLSHETRPRWNLITFLFMIMVSVMIVFGSIWIMNNLNYNLM